ncbi:hypothetical protein BG015_007958 [Linnemannia schmuckeri]|uniref:F-box protein n=1 Tax=Linnemannia schmuckeri TaxID=64567 RepID=A0A9P5VF43_9FUNG|nr:hypothetical protein BG015_007958 [Linnemannia schmuckeri]
MPFKRLVGLSITMPLISKWSTTHCHNLYVRLVRANPGLKSLSWDGSIANFVPILDPEAFAGLDQLESLTLHWWDGSGGRMALALRAVARTLTSLKIAHFVGVKEGDLDVMMIQDGSNKDGRGANSDDREELSRTLCFPALKHLSCELSGVMRLESLVGRCPRLESLELTIIYQTDFDRVAQGIRSSCPNLRSLHIGDDMHPERILPILQSCPLTPGLQELRLCLKTVDKDILTTILSHASTLKSLDLSIARCNPLGMEYIRRVLKAGQQLENFSLKVVRGKESDYMAGLTRERWECLQLKTLCLELPFAKASPNPIPREKRSQAMERTLQKRSRDVLALKSISNTKAAMGWLSNKTVLSQRDYTSSGSALQLWMIFRTVEKFKLKSLRSVTWDN